jgi:Transposase, Mutator family
VDYVYLWADGIHVNIRLEEHKLCLLVMIGVRADGRKELVALADGYRESAESWADLARDCARRGMRAPALAVGDGALGFWGALRDVFPETTEQRCWFHKTANVLAALPRSAHPGAKKALAEIWGAEDKDHARAAVKAFDAAYGAKFPKAAAKITDDAGQLLAFYDYPCEHWVHLRTTNPIESAFATVRHRTKVTKGPGSRAAGLAMAFKLIESAQDHWRIVNAPHLVASGPRRSNLHQRQAHRATRQGSPARSHLKDLDPQVLTIAHPVMRTEPAGHVAPQTLTPGRGHVSACRGTITIWILHARIIAHTTGPGRSSARRAGVRRRVPDRHIAVGPAPDRPVSRSARPAVRLPSWIALARHPRDVGVMV